MKLISSSPFLCLLLIPALVVSPLGAQSPVIAATPSVAATGQLQGSALDNADLQLRVIEGAAAEAKVNSTLGKGLTVAVTNASGAAVSDAAVALRLPDSGATGTFADGSHAAVAYTDAAGQAHFAGLHWNQTPGAVVLRVTATKGTSHAALLLDETLTSDVRTVVQVPAAPLAPAAMPPAQPVVQPTQPVLQPVIQPVLKPVIQPGQPAISRPLAKTGASPVLPPTSPTATAAAKPQPTVTVTGASPNATHSSKTKWIIIAAVVAGAAGGGFAMMGKSKSTPSAPTNSLTIGTPSVSVGH